MNAQPHFSVRITLPKGTFWWCGAFKEQNLNGGRATHVFGLTEYPTHALRWATIKGALAFAQALDGDMRNFFEVDRINVVEMHYSTVRGWVPNDEGQVPA